MRIDHYLFGTGPKVESTASTDPAAVELRKIREMITGFIIVVLIVGAIVGFYFYYRHSDKAAKCWADHIAAGYTDAEANAACY